MNIPGYDRWKLATPPEYDEPTECPRCGAELLWDKDGPYCAEPDWCGCGWDPLDAQPDPDLGHDDK